jgi:hypothetical protein
MPAQRKSGLPLWGKIALGCGVAMLLFLGSCVVLIGYGVHRGSEAMDQAWVRMRKEVAELSSEDGARKMYQQNPGLADRYPTEEDFVKASAIWRPKLTQLPEQPPTIRDLMEGKGNVQLMTHFENGRKRSRIRVKLQDGSRLIVETDEKGVTDIRMD